MGLSKAALGGLISDLTAEGLVLEHPPTAIARGRHPAPLQVNANRFSVLGLHLAPHGLEVGLYDALGVQKDVLYTPSHVGEGIERVLAQVIESSRALMARAKKLKIGEVAALAIATPGPLDAVRGIVLGAPKFPELNGVNLKLKLEQALKLPVRLERDVNAAATGHLRQFLRESQGIADTGDAAQWRGSAAIFARARQKLAVSVRRKLRGSTGWKWMSFTPPTGSFFRREA